MKKNPIRHSLLLVGNDATRIRHGFGHYITQIFSIVRYCLCLNAFTNNFFWILWKTRIFDEFCEKQQFLEYFGRFMQKLRIVVIILGFSNKIEEIFCRFLKKICRWFTHQSSPSAWNLFPVSFILFLLTVCYAWIIF